MFEFQTLVSLAMQIARLVPDNKARFHRGVRHRPMGSAGGCGSCPCCHEFVWVDFPAPDQPAPCPRCGKPILFLEPLGPS
jgi:hypothetical protein